MNLAARRVLPCLIDVGTDNAALRDLDMYMGLHQPRLTDNAAYMDILDEVSGLVGGRQGADTMVVALFC